MVPNTKIGVHKNSNYLILTMKLSSGNWSNEQENVSQLMKESESIKLLRERSTGDNIFDAERQVFSKNSDGTINIARGTTDPGYCLFNLSYLSS